MGVILAVDGGNTKTDVVVASLVGDPLAYLRGPGSNSHGPEGSAGCVATIAAIVERIPFERPAAHAALFLCGADSAQDLAELSAEVEARGWARAATVDNDTFALLRAGSDGAAAAVAVVCGAGINCVGRAADGRVVRYPGLGWETGDWGGGEQLGREALFLAARAEDGRGEPTRLAELVRGHFGLASATAVGEAVHYRRLRPARLGELAPGIVALAAEGDVAAGGLVDRLAREIALLVERALRDLDAEDADVVLGGGMLAGGGRLLDLVRAALPPGARPVVPDVPPAAGAALAALDAAGAERSAAARLRDAFARGLVPEDVR